MTFVFNLNFKCTVFSCTSHLIIYCEKTNWYSQNSLCNTSYLVVFHLNNSTSYRFLLNIRDLQYVTIHLMLVNCVLLHYLNNTVVLFVFVYMTK